MNQWDFKVERGLHQDCKVPQLADSVLRAKYAVGTPIKLSLLNIITARVGNYVNELSEEEDVNE